MGKLIYSGVTSIDGYVADRQGNFDWAKPDEELHTFINDLELRARTYLYGRRMYEVMLVWETMQFAEEYMQERGRIWRSADKVVYSTTLDAASSARTRIERQFDPPAIRQLKSAAEQDITIGGADLAAQAIKVGLVDEYHLYVTPVVIGGGTPFLPDDIRLDLELADERRFAGDIVHLHYRTRV